MSYSLTDAGEQDKVNIRLTDRELRTIIAALEWLADCRIGESFHDLSYLRLGNEPLTDQETQALGQRLEFRITPETA